MISLQKEFTNYLSSCGLNKISIRNYLADLNKFISWFQKFTGEKLSETSLQSSHLNLYENYLNSASIPETSKRRYLTTVKKFFFFINSSLLPLNQIPLITSQPQSFITPKNQPASFSSLSQDFNQLNHSAQTSDVLNELYRNFSAFLISQGLSKVSVRNYLNDLEKFISWFESQYSKNFDISSLNNSLINLFDQSLSLKEIPANTRRRYQTSLKQFLKFVNPEVILPAPPKPYQKVSKDTKVSLFPKAETGGGGGGEGGKGE